MSDRVTCGRCRMGDHDQCTGVGCYACDDPTHRKVGVACPGANPFAERIMAKADDD